MKVAAGKIVIIGAGNVATQLGKALKKANYTIIQIYSKSIYSASTLAKYFNCAHTNHIENIDTSADLYIIAVKDDAIIDIVKKIRLTDKIIVHTSGTVEMNVLLPVSINIGVLYPLQTFTKSRILNFKTIPICLEANNISTYKTLQLISKSISNNVQKINSNQRKKIHLAAIFANNFTNHLFTISASILKSANLSLDILKPLILETVRKINTTDPNDNQTGPAIRNDKKTMDTHLKMLINNKDYFQLYKLISKSIKTTKKNIYFD